MVRCPPPLGPERGAPSLHPARNCRPIVNCPSRTGRTSPGPGPVPCGRGTTLGVPVPAGPCENSLATHCRGMRPTPMTASQRDARSHVRRGRPGLPVGSAQGPGSTVPLGRRIGGGVSTGSELPAYSQLSLGDREGEARPKVHQRDLPTYSQLSLGAGRARPGPRVHQRDLAACSQCGWRGVHASFFFLLTSQLS